MADRQQVRQQFEETFQGADFPVNSQDELDSQLPEGEDTTFEIGDETIRATEINQKTGSQGNYPYENSQQLVDDLMEGLENEGHL